MILLLIAFVAIYSYFSGDATIPYDRPDPLPVEVPTFTEASLDFVQNFYEPDHLPFMGSAIIDVDSDGQPELWLGGGKGQVDGLFRYDDGTFVNITQEWKLDDKPDAAHSYGAATWDMDKDGDDDLLVCRPDDVYIYYNQGSSFSKGQALNIPLNEKSVPLSLTLGDIDGDGLVDMFVSAYIAQAFVEGQTIFTDKSYGASSLLMKNIGGGKFQNVTTQSGLDYVHNTFVAVLVDLDDDSHLDLVVSHDTGEIRTYKNNGSGIFKMIDNPLTDHFAYPMGISVGDYNNDGRPDLFASNVGTTMPRAMLKGDLDAEQEKNFVTDWILFKNEGGFNFSNAAKDAQLADYEFGWGSIFQDFNLDGLQDLSVVENYVSLPNFKLVKLPGRFLLNTPDHQFVATGQESGVTNPHYGTSPLSADFNNDGYPDLVFANLAGPSKAYINDGGSQSFVKVQLEKSARSLGAKVVVTKTDNSKSTDWLISGEGLASEQSHTLVFGFDKGQTVSAVDIYYSDGHRSTLDAPSVNTTLYVSDSVSVSLTVPVVE